MRRTGGSGPTLLGLVLLLGSACNSDRPETASADFSVSDLRVTVVRVATHPFLARFRLTLEFDGPRGCHAATELFPDTGYAGRRNLYRQADGRFLLLGQYDARVIDPVGCTITLVEFSSLPAPGEFLGAFDVEVEKRWRYIPAVARVERPFEKQ